MSDITNFYKTIRILVRKGNIIFCRLLERYVFQQRPKTVLSPDDWIIDHFLHRHISRLTSTSMGERNTRIFFPGFSQRTHLAAWNMHMLCFVLTELCVDFPEEVSRSINEIRRIRDNLCFREGVLSDNELKQTVTSMKRIFSCLAQYSVEDVQQAIDQLNVEIDEDLRAPITESEQRRLFTELVEWHTDEKDQREKLREVPMELRTINERIVSVRNTTKAVPPTEEASLKLPVAIIILQPKAKTPHQSLYVTKRLATAFQEAQSTSVDDVEKEVKKIIETLKSENLLLNNVERGCIELHIQCSNIESFTELIEDCVSGKLTKRFEPVQQAIRQQKGFDEYTQDIFIYKDDFDRCMIKLASNIDDYLTDNEMGYFASSQRQINMDQNLSNSCKEITLTVKSNNKEDLQKFKQFKEDGRLHKTFERLSTVLNTTYGTDDISLNVAMEQLPNIEMVNVETSTSEEQKIEFPSAAFNIVKSGWWLYTKCL